MKCAATESKRKRTEEKNVFLVSDSTGNLLEHLFNSLLTQFPKEKFKPQLFSFIKDSVQLDRAFASIKEGLVLHAVVDKALKKRIEWMCQQKKIPCLDVTGPAADFLERASGVSRFAAAHPVHHVDASYFDRIRAIEFAMEHDDSANLEGIGHADIILTGISRVSKSPVSLLLAYRGFCVANVSFVSSQGLPQELENHSKKNVVALTLQPKKLSEIRKRRLEEWGMKPDAYQDLRGVIREVMDAETIYRKKGWPVIDTTELTVEEICSLVLMKLNMQPKMF